MHNQYRKKGLTANSIFGVPTTSDNARQWEARQKELEQEGLGFRRLHVVKAATPEVFDEGEQADISIINDLTLDRDSEIVLPSGGDAKQFTSNPVITLNHNYNDLPVGRAAWVKQEPKGKKAERWKMKTLYAKRPDDWEGLWKPEEVFALVKGGYLPGKSIGFIAESRRQPTQKEIDIRPELVQCRGIIDRWTLIEVAVATVPCNPSALVEATSKGLVRKAVLDTLGITLPDMPQDELEDVWQWATKEIEQEEIVTPAFIRKAPSLQSRLADALKRKA